MNIKHHPDEATIVAYASGTLDEAFAVLVSCHLESCSECRDRLATANSVGGAALADMVETIEPDAGSFGRLLERISISQPEEGVGTRPENESKAPKQKSTPRALHSYIDSDLEEIDWRKVGPGIWQKPIQLSENANSSLRLLRIKKGCKVPEHGHNGQELTLILQGAYQDEIGHFGAGDVADLDEDIEHQPIVVSDEDCICLAATEAPTRFKGIASRLMQPFIGI